MNDGRHAAVEFQKLLDHPGIIGRDVDGALVQLQMARAQKVCGDDVAAREYYERFLNLWKDADPDIPIRQKLPRDSSVNLELFSVSSGEM
jgi:eukaryotic-like serine/threonine-protein kinase